MISNEQLAKEFAAINARRTLNGLAELSIEQIAATAQGPTGLALSGGGIRSAASCLGAVQALYASGKLRHIDYLSTVSGGGYTGCCLAANMSERRFPFQNDRNDLNDLQDSAAVKYIRDHTNYLMPAGFADLLASVGVILRGLIASGVLVLGPLLLMAGLTAYGWNWRFSPIRADGNFLLTSCALALLVLFLFGVALHRSFLEEHGRDAYEFRGTTARFAIGGIIVVAILFVLELQPYAIKALRRPDLGQSAMTKFVAACMTASKYLAPVAGIMAASAGWLADIVRTNEQSASKIRFLGGFAMRAALWVAAMALPVLLWHLYLVLVNAAIPTNGNYDHAFGVLRPYGPYLAAAYLVVAVLLIVLSWLLEPNANSLHRLYRDRLGDAFLFLAPEGNEESVNSLDRMKLSALNVGTAPYLLVNTALNIQRSEYANKRGRDADFFLFSRHYIGSRATGYVPTETIEAAVPTLDMATVMAISGAAASSNMGASPLRPLSFTLAVLNVRLGYWMTNPSRFKDERIDFGGREVAGGGLRRYLRSAFYLWSEMFSTLDETNDAVYLTDGGHIENLGIYELLKRRCSLIVAVDAEADPELRFPSLMALQRYARLDLGVRIELPWGRIRERYVACQGELKDSALTGTVKPGASGCHVAIGKILYPDGPEGRIVYLKSALTGDENDLILNYKRKYPSFPHETTTDQFFAEEQFEAYRALGFHAMHRFLEGEDDAAGLAAGATKAGRKAEIDGWFPEALPPSLPNPNAP